MELQALQIPPPRNWEDFEDLCLDLFRRVWGDPTAQRNGRGGQEQAGVDVWGLPTVPGSGHCGVQCKGKDVGLGRLVSEAELRGEVAKALKFTPRLTHWILATTGPKDARIERVARDISDDHARQGLFRVQVLAWDDLKSLLADHRDVVEKHYPDFRDFNRLLVDQLGQFASRQEALFVLLEKSMSSASLAGAAATVAVQDAAPAPAVDVADLKLQTLIDSARDLNRSGKPRTALAMFDGLIAERWEAAGTRARFRLLTNKGACHYGLGGWTEAADLFDEALQYGGDDPQAGCNVALASILRGEVERARVTCDGLLAVYPGNVQAASLRILAGFDEPDMDDPLASIPLEAVDAAQVIAMAARWHRHHGDHVRCLSMLERARALAPGDHDVAVDLAVALLAPVVSDPDARTSHRQAGTSRAEVDRAMELLTEAWAAVRATEAVGNRVEAALNLAVALDLDGRHADADEVVREASRFAPDDVRVVRHRAHLLLEGGRAAEALDILGGVDGNTSQDVEAALTRFRALAQLGRYEEAAAIKAAVEGLIDGERRIALRADGIRLLWEMGRRDEAVKEADRLLDESPREPRYLVASAFVRNGLGDPAAARGLVREALRVSPTRHATCRMFIADAALALGDWDACADALAEIGSARHDGEALRLRVAALVNADRRREARTILAELTPPLSDDPFFRRAGARVSAAIGDLVAAREDAEMALSAEPGDHGMRMIWCEAATRSGDTGAVDRFLDGPLREYENAPVGTRVAMAATLDHAGRHASAVAMAYDTLRSNWNDRDAHKAFATMLLSSPGAVAAIPVVEAIGPDSSFVVASESLVGAKTTYVLESRSLTLDPRLGEIAPTSAIALRATGLRVGDRIRLQDHPAADDLPIIEVGHKYLLLGRRSLAEYGSMFPDDGTFFGFTMDPADPGKAVGKIRAVAERRRKHVEAVADAYAVGGFPLAMAARATGTEPIAAWFGLAAEGRTLDVSEGTRAEIDRASASLARRPHLVVDPLTFWIAGVHGWLDALHATFGPLGLTQSGVAMIRRAVEGDGWSRMGDGTVMQAGPEGGAALVITTSTPEQQGSARALASGILDFALGGRCVVLDALPRMDFDEETRSLGRLMDPSFLDAVAAADGSGRILLCEDRRVRTIAAKCGRTGVASAWLQPALMEASKAGKLPPAAFDEASATLALSGHDFTIIGEATLALVAKRNAWSAEGEFARLAMVCGRPLVKVESALVVASRFLSKLWSSDAPMPGKADLTHTLVSAVARGHPAEATEMLATLRRRAGPRRTGSRLEHLRATARFHRVMDRVALDASKDPPVTGKRRT